MRLVTTLLMFGGYVFVYASVANHGKFASEPWAGLFTDAYTDTSAQTQDGNSQQQGSGKGQQNNGPGWDQVLGKPDPLPLDPIPKIYDWLKGVFG